MRKAVVLAAGEGKRMKSETPKVLHKILGVSMLKNIINELIKSDIEEIIVIVGYGGEEVIEEISSFDSRISYRVQPVGEDVPYGTGFAVMQALDAVRSEDEILVVCGDTPLLRGETLSKLMYTNKELNSKASVLTAIVEDNFGYGRIVRNSENFVEKIVEEKDANECEKRIKEINSGVYAFSGDVLLENLKELDTNNSQGELYLTDIIENLNKKSMRVGAYVVEDADEILGVNSRSQLVECENKLKLRINAHWINNGVTIENPQFTEISPEVEIGIDSIIKSGVRILGNSKIGKSVVIEGDTRIENSIIGDNCEIRSTYIENSVIGDDVTIGPFAHIRPDTEIKRGAHIGNFVELKKSVFGENSKAGHLAYIGNADVGKNVNIGCGAITVNYDGKKKSKTVIKDGAFIGSNSNLVAPVEIGENAYIACGSTITKKVDPEDLALERSEQKVIKGWVRRKKLIK